MIFGIPKELAPFKQTPEYRVGFSPMGVRELMLYGAKFYVETKAGEGAGFSDADYEKAGATVVYSKEEAYKRADIVLKVRRPQQEEYSYIKEGQTIMGFIHLVTAKKEFYQLINEKKITLIGYEIIQRDDGRLPVVIPMSEMAGKLSVQIAGRLLESPNRGRGILLGGIPGIPPAEVVILGAGTLGCNAAKSFAGIGANVYVLDINRDRLDEIACQTAGSKVTTMFATKHNIEKLVKFADVVICAVLVPGKRSPILITREMVRSMRRGSVLIDFSIDQGGCSETSKIAPSGQFIYTIDGVIHFCMPNATTLVARTATHTITSGIFPYLRIITESGLEQTLNTNPDLRRGIYAADGVIKEEYRL
ncbi:MAG TPA: alanine dehydrogenase [candidate division WOR-3 bacterium]|uniref:alanine dehydrogenase n=1 Tax=candidate division WOR-3 bacterium TaxID=2052148 RepID=A0A9C9ENZ7_UNCW3|nr:alanine dehydrogenase [candidate division WOR-3 bacterium]